VTEAQPAGPLEPAAPGSSEPGPNTARLLVVGFVVLVVAFVAYMALGMPGMDHGGDGSPQMDHEMDEGMLPSVGPGSRAR
jgi:hypothetical protein